jgi:UDP-perosamine 4-acetyltransferase
MNSPVIRCLIMAAGGHAAVLIDTMRRSRSVQPDCLLDSDPARWQTELYGIPIIGGDEMLAKMQSRGVDRFTVGLGRAGATDHRRSLFDTARAAGLEPITIVDPTAIVSDQADLAEGAQIFARSVVNIGSRIGANSVINTGAIVEHDCTVGDHVFVAPGAVLAGGVRVGDQAFIGMGAMVLPGISIGQAAVVGAGALVTKSVPTAATVVGMPARQVRSQ